MTATAAQVSALLRKVLDEREQHRLMIQQVCQQYKDLERSLREQVRSTTEEIDAIQGRRIYYPLVGRISFTAAQAGTRGLPITLKVSQDGPFIQTAWPLAIWKPNEPSNAANFGRWRPPYSWPLPDQVLNTDIIDISWEIVDSGSQRVFQSEAVPPLFSRPDQLLELPVPTLFSPSSNVQFIPTYEAINFNPGGEGEIATTGGELVVVLPGYKIVNM